MLNKHFQHKRDFQTCFDTKICLPAIETWIISGLDITLAAPRRSSFDSLDKRRKRLRKRQPTLTYSQHENNNSVRHCSGRDDDIVTYPCATLHIRKLILVGSVKTPSIGTEVIASRWYASGQHPINCLLSMNRSARRRVFCTVSKTGQIGLPHFSENVHRTHIIYLVFKYV